MGKSQKVNDVIYDARSLGTPKMLILGIQHMFAMKRACRLHAAIVSTTAKNEPSAGVPHYFRLRMKSNSRGQGLHIRGIICIFN